MSRSLQFWYILVSRDHCKNSQLLIVIRACETFTSYLFIGYYTAERQFVSSFQDIYCDAHNCAII
jgi:hypothetical protein